MEFKKIITEDLEKIKELSPEGWVDICPIIENYIKYKFCHSIKLIENNELLGIGTAIFYENTSWIAHLIVPEKHRNKGYGSKILNYLCEYCFNNGFKSILLFATEMGYPLYKKYGFKIQTEYLQYEKTHDFEYNYDKNIRNISVNDYSKIFELDYIATGENRQKLLTKYLDNGFVYLVNENIIGFYLLNLGEGLIIAMNEVAGLELMKLRISNKKQSTVPVKNNIANEYFRENNFKELKKIKRMIYGNGIILKDENIYNRIGGNFG